MYSISGRDIKKIDVMGDFGYSIISIKQFIGFIIIFFHIFFTICILLFPYITDNLFYLLIIILINTTIITQWYLFEGILYTIFI